jgi:hypothetical protein
MTSGVALSADPFPPVPHLVATFVYDLPRDAWSWTPVVPAAADLGAGRGDVAEHLEGVVAAALGGGPVVYRAALTDAEGCERDLLVLAESDADEPGPLTGLRGFVFDLVAPRTDSAEDEVFELRIECDLLWQALRDSDVTGQAKGILMVSCGCTADVAADVLDELVRRSGLTMRDVAEWLIRTSCSGQGSVAEALDALGFRGER